MKKIFLCVMAVGAMLATPSCIKNDEPAGIEEMRKGKAELLKAEALVQQAEAKIKEAEAKVQEAYAAQEAAIARKREAEAQLKELEVEMQQARNEEEKARIAKNMAEIEADTALAAEEAKKALLEAQAETAKAEAEYEKSMAQLQVWVMNNGAESVYAKQLTKVIGKLAELRTEIVGYQKEIADATTELYNTQVDEKAWVRKQQASIAAQEKSIALYNDAIAYWSALSKANEVKWGEELDALKAKREKAYPAYVDLKVAAEEKAAAVEEIEEAMGQKRDAFNEEHNRKTEATQQEFTEKIAAAQEPASGKFVLTIPVSEKLYSALGAYDEASGRWTNPFDTYAWEYSYEEQASLYNRAEQQKYAGDIANMLLRTNVNDEAYSGLIYELRRKVFTPTDLANAEQKLVSLKQAATEAEAAHKEDVEAFNEALKAFREAAAAYKFDWTKTRQATLQNDIEAEWAKFLEVENPTDAQKKAIAATVADYIKVRDAFEEGFDEKVTTDDGDVLLSAWIVENYEVFVMGENRTIFENKISAYMDYTAPATVTAKLAAAADKAYGINALLLHEITAEDCYKNRNELLNPIKEAYLVTGGYWTEITKVEYVYGSFYNWIWAKRIAESTEAQIKCQDELKSVIAAAEEYFKEYSTIAESVEEAVEKLLEEKTAAEEALEAEQKAFDESMKAEEKKLQEARYAAFDADAAMKAAKDEYDMCASDIARIERYINMGAGNNENGEWVENVELDIKEYVEKLTGDVAEMGDELEKTKNLLKTYEETGFTNKLLEEQLASIQVRIDNAKEKLADAQTRFDALVAQKDQLVALMKNE